MSTTWVRTVQAALSWTADSSLIAAVDPGNTVVRIRFAWGFYGYTAPSAGLSNIQGNAMVLGLCSVPSTDSVPNPRTTSTDVDPPLQRWLWWEARIPSVKAYSSDGNVVVWEASDPQETVDSKGMVTANVGAGDTLGIWASWAPGTAWDASGAAYVWYSASLLYKTS